jgi:cytochrome c biogenesis protein CcdA
MLSSDKNVESIGQLVEALKAYVGLQKEYLELNAIEKVVRLVTALTVAIVFVILGFAVLFFLTFALVYWIAPITGLALAFLLVALLFVVLLALVCMFRKKWIEQPLVRFLANTLLN